MPPSCSSIAYSNLNDNTIWVREWNGGSSHGIFPRWTQDGQSLVYIARRRGVQGEAELQKVTLADSRLQTLGELKSLRNFFGDVGPQDRYVYTYRDGDIHILDPVSKQDRKLEGARGFVVRWSPSGREIAYIVPARQQGDPEAGLWIYDFGNSPRQVFRGWVLWHDWAGPDELLLAQGVPDPRGVLHAIEVLEENHFDIMFGNLSRTQVDYEAIKPILLTRTPREFDSYLAENSLKRSHHWSFGHAPWFCASSVDMARENLKKLLIFRLRKYLPVTEQGYTRLRTYLAEDVYFMKQAFARQYNWFLRGHHMYFEDVHICEQKGHVNSARNWRRSRPSQCISTAARSTTFDIPSTITSWSTTSLRRQ